jgi:CspA family cold shock protein
VLQCLHKESVEFLQLNFKIMQTGTIKTLTEKGFGFIAREGETKDLFFHSNDLSGVSFAELKVGDTVTFDVVDGQKGPNAQNVKRV